MSSPSVIPDKSTDRNRTPSYTYQEWLQNSCTQPQDKCWTEPHQCTDGGRNSGLCSVVKKNVSKNVTERHSTGAVH